MRNGSLFSRMRRVEVLQWDECNRDALRRKRASDLRERSLPERRTSRLESDHLQLGVLAAELGLIPTGGL